MMEGTTAAASRTSRTLDTLILAMLVLFLGSSAFSIAASEIGYFSAFVLWICRMIYRKTNEIPRTALDYVVLAYAGAEVLATLFADQKLYSLNYLQKRLLLLPIIYVLVANIRTPAQLRWLFVALVGSAVGVSLYSFSDVFAHVSEYLHFQRRLGEFQIYMTAGGIMMIALLLLLPFALHPRTPSKIRILALFALAPLATNLFFTFTRSSWLGLAAGVLVIAGYRSKRILVPVGVLAVVILLVSPPEIRERFLSIFDPQHPTNVSRVNMWKTGFRIIADHPLVGIGDVGTETVWDRYSDPGWQWEGHLHNNLIMWCVTLGGIGLAVLLALFVKLWLECAGIERRLRGDWFGGSLALGALAVQAGFHVNGLFEWNFGDTEIITILWAITGLVIAAERLAPAGSRA